MTTSLWWGLCKRDSPALLCVAEGGLDRVWTVQNIETSHRGLMGSVSLLKDMLLPESSVLMISKLEVGSCIEAKSVCM